MASSAMKTSDKAVIVDLNITSKEAIDRKNFRISCSGTFLDYSRGYIITNGLILTPFLERNIGRSNSGQNVIWTEFSQFLSDFNENHIIECNNNDSRGFLDFIESQCEITVYVQNVNDGNRRFNYVRKRCETNINPFVALVKAAKDTRRTKNDNDSPSYRPQSARLLAVWRCESLNRVLNSVLSQTNSFSFVDSATQSQETASTVPETIPSKHNEEQTRTLLPFFVLLKIAPLHDVPIEKNDVISNSHRPIIDRFIASAVDSFDEKFLSNCFDSIVSASQKLFQYFSSRSSESRDVEPSKRDVAASFDCEGHLVREELIEVLSEACKDLPRATVASKLSLISTPFGNLSPSVFLNSVSEGIVTNVAGDDDILVMTDARCVPGCEGGALYVQTQPGLKRKLLGIVIAPFCWRQNEWVGLTFACSLRPLLISLLESIGEPSMVHSSSLSEGAASLCTLSDNVALVKIGSRWGSAVVVDLGVSSLFSNERILLTCCHVIRQQTGSKVRLRFTKRGTADRFHVDAVVLYSTPPGQIYDVAVLRVDDVAGLRYFPKGLQLSNMFVKEGDRVHVVGHGLFDDHVSLPASITSGVVSKVLYRNRKQVLIQSTCAVHPGVSGGALVNAETNQLSGIVVCNARDAVSGACYPHINLSIPSTILEPVLQHFRKNRDAKIFQKLQDSDPIVNSYWQLGYNRLDKINSKL